ncbi:syntaxin-8-like protein [Cricetulus griseus]|nr:syntaxin-8-like protein [Cricetulus griseus]
MVVSHHVVARNFSGPLEEQTVLLTIEPSLQPPECMFNTNWLAVAKHYILEIIDDLANLVENTDEKLRTEARRVTLVDRKSTSCDYLGLWIITWLSLALYLISTYDSIHLPANFKMSLFFTAE